MTGTAVSLPALPADPRLVLVGMDDESLSHLPLERVLHTAPLPEPFTPRYSKNFTPPVPPLSHSMLSLLARFPA